MEPGRRVAYGGGNLPLALDELLTKVGMLNLTTRARDPKGRDFCVSVTWNAPEPLDEKRLFELYVSLFRSL